MKRVLLIACSILLISCNTKPDNDPAAPLNARSIIDKAITAHGSNHLDNSVMDFTFRDKMFKVTRDSGAYSYVRTSIIDVDSITDRLDNSGFSQARNSIVTKIPDSISVIIGSGVNSVVYFAQLPYGLDGKAVKKELMEEVTLFKTDYHKVKVTFNENGGGEDHEDVFIYWINKENFLIDYLAYSYCEDDCGFRFRKAFNRRTINKVIVQDYENYKANGVEPVIENLDRYFIDGDLELLSIIATEKVSVKLN